jgi:NAD(P)H-dependent FMN reductase
VSPRLQVIVASTRPTRVGPAVGEWFYARAAEHGGFELDWVDLAELRLPFMDEPHHPRLREYEHDHTRRWSERVDAADAFAMVTPEYNHGFNAPLKNAVDFLHHEWSHKPVGIVSYGGVAAGTRAAQMLKQVLLAQRMVPLTTAVSIPFVARFVDDEGRLEPNDTMQAAAMDVLDDLLAHEAALRPLREAA